MEITEYHPFKSKEAKEKYLKLYDTRAKEWPIPSETKIVDTSYGQTFVRISGPADAPSLVLLHSMGTSSLMWLSNIEALSKDYRTYAIDIFGHGRSVNIKSLNDTQDFVNWLDELFNVLELGNNINLMGMSLGSWITSQYALKFPERLNKIVLLAPVATIQPISSMFMIRGLLAMLPIDYFYKSMMYWTLEDLGKKDKEKAEERVNDSLFALKCFKTRRPPSPTVLSDNELQNIKIPALYMVGENEKICSAKKAINRLNAVAPQIKTVLIQDAGHDLPIVQVEMVNEKVLEFLK